MGLQNEIEAANKRFMAAAGAQDAAALAALYTVDGQVLAAGTPPVVGHAALAAFWQGVFDSGIGGAVLEILELTGDEAGLTEFGQFTLTDSQGNAADRGRYIVVWQHEGGQWKLHRDMFTSSGPL